MTTNRQSAHLLRRTARAAMLPALAITLTGCVDDDLAQQAAQSESILALISNTNTPADIIAWANNLYDPDQRARGTVLVANANFGGEQIFVDRLYRAYLTDEDAAVRAAALLGLSLHGSPSDVPAIAALLTDDNVLVRRQAAVTLQRVHNPQCIPALLKTLDEESEFDSTVRASAADALGQYAERRVLDRLIYALDDQSLAVTAAALKSLTTLTGQTLPDERREWAAWLDTQNTPFTHQTAYVYPAFERALDWIERLPMWPTPPNEVATFPIGMTPPSGMASD